MSDIKGVGFFSYYSGNEDGEKQMESICFGFEMSGLVSD